MRIGVSGARHLLASAAGGLFAIALCAAPAAAMTYRLIAADLPGCREACPKIIVASGTIQENEHHLFADFVESVAKTEKLSSMLVLESPGGFFGGAAVLGMMVRKLKMTVVVGQPISSVVTREAGLTSATCASACVLVLAGGQTRLYVMGSRIGVHRSHMGQEVRDPSSRAVVSGTVEHGEVKDAYVSYFKKMGINPALTSLIDKTPSDSIYWLSPQELTKYRLARDSSTKDSSTKR